MATIRTTKQIPLTDIQTHPRNANHGDAGAISLSLKHNGQYRAIVVSEATGNILAGNHTYLAAQMNGDTSMLAHLIPGLSADDEVRIMVADNQYARLAYTDDEALSELLTDLVATDVGLDASGFDTDQLDELLHDLGEGLTWDDAVEALGGGGELQTMVFTFHSSDKATITDALAEVAGEYEGETTNLNGQTLVALARRVL